MDIGFIRLKSIVFPSLAGEYQRAGATAALLRELGDNYAKYHSFLADEMTRNPRPVPSARVDLEQYFAAHARCEELVRAEILLRICRLNRASGWPIDTPPPLERPLLDRNDRLVAGF